MSLTENVFAALQGLCGGRVFPDEADDGVVAPYIVFTEVITTEHNYLDDPAKQNTRLQVDVFAKTRVEADAVAQQAIDALTVSPVKAVCISRQRFTEDEVRLRRTTVDFSIWH